MSINKSSSFVSFVIILIRRGLEKRCDVHCVWICFIVRRDHNSKHRQNSANVHSTHAQSRACNAKNHQYLQRTGSWFASSTAKTTTGLVHRARSLEACAVWNTQLIEVTYKTPSYIFKQRTSQETQARRKSRRVYTSDPRNASLLNYNGLSQPSFQPLEWCQYHNIHCCESFLSYPIPRTKHMPHGRLISTI